MLVRERLTLNHTILKYITHDSCCWGQGADSCHAFPCRKSVCIHANSCEAHAYCRLAVQPSSLHKFWSMSITVSTFNVKGGLAKVICQKQWKSWRHVMVPHVNVYITDIFTGWDVWSHCRYNEGRVIVCYSRSLSLIICCSGNIRLGGYRTHERLALRIDGIHLDGISVTFSVQSACLWNRDRNRVFKQVYSLATHPFSCLADHVGNIRCDSVDPSLAWTGVKDSGRGVSCSGFGK